MKPSLVNCTIDFYFVSPWLVSLRPPWRQDHRSRALRCSGSQNAAETRYDTRQPATGRHRTARQAEQRGVAGAAMQSENNACVQSRAIPATPCTSAFTPSRSYDASPRIACGAPPASIPTVPLCGACTLAQRPALPAEFATVWTGPCPAARCAERRSSTAHRAQLLSRAPRWRAVRARTAGRVATYTAALASKIHAPCIFLRARACRQQSACALSVRRDQCRAVGNADGKPPARDLRHAFFFPAVCGRPAGAD